MLVKIDGITNKEFSKDNNLFLKFLRENTCSGKVTPEVEVFKGAELSRETFHWVMSTFDTDRDFEKVDQTGWELKNYLANPVVLWSHDYSIPAIGVAKNVKADMSLEGDIVFNDKDFDEFGWSIGQRVKAGVLSCGSVGFRVDEVEFLDAADRECDLIFRKQELLEFSICCVPSNPFANVKLTKSQKKGSPLSFYDRICAGLQARA